jgi:prepilin-type processing-associated H-X9-DG protein
MIRLLAILVLLAAAVALLIPIIERARVRARLVRCADQLREIGTFLAEYEHASSGRLPVSATVDGAHGDVLQSLRSAGIAPNAHLWFCPATSDPTLQFSEANFRAGRLGYYWYAARGISDNPALSKFLRTGVTWPRELDTSMDRRTWVVSDVWVSALPTAHAGYRKGVNYLMLDGSVGFVGESPRQAFR